jgi:predicted O-methyltransferase YrrM
VTQIALFARSASVNALRLLLKNRQLGREYLSSALQQYDELMGRGLRPKQPVNFIYKQRWASRVPCDTVELPSAVELGGGTRLDELLILAIVTRVLRPSKVFEIGTFMGQTTSAFVLNAPPGAPVITLDLPPDADPQRGSNARRYIDTDVALVKQRKVGSFLLQAGLDGRYQQIFCDSIQFDPTPHEGTVELGFIDGAHSREYVENDTRKMARMMSTRGLVFWHDYGGKGRFRGLSEYLEGLARRIALYRVPKTSLAWAPAAGLKSLL